MQRCTPDTELEVGKTVFVNNMKGIVINCNRVPATPCGMINVHTIKYTHKIKRLAVHQIKWIEINNPKTERVNYSCISYEN